MIRDAKGRTCWYSEEEAFRPSRARIADMCLPSFGYRCTSNPGRLVCPRLNSAAFLGKPSAYLTCECISVTLSSGNQGLSLWILEHIPGPLQSSASITLCTSVPGAMLHSIKLHSMKEVASNTKGSSVLLCNHHVTWGSTCAVPHGQPPGLFPGTLFPDTLHGSQPPPTKSIFLRESKPV